MHGLAPLHGLMARLAALRGLTAGLAALHRLAAWLVALRRLGAAHRFGAMRRFASRSRCFAPLTVVWRSAGTAGVVVVARRAQAAPSPFARHGRFARRRGARITGVPVAIAPRGALDARP